MACTDRKRIEVREAYTDADFVVIAAPTNEVIRIFREVINTLRLKIKIADSVL